MKNFKEWFKFNPYWLKGGLIGVLILIILLVMAFVEFKFFVNPMSVDSGLLPMGLFLKIIIFSIVPLIPLGIFDSHDNSLITIIYILLTVLYYFLAGVLIGWIYGKIKLKKKV